MGDGMLAEFGSVVDAVECAASLQRGLAERNANVPEDRRVQVRIGINLGEVIVEGDDRYGEGVNIAARLEQLADPGGICVSGKVAREVEKKHAFGFEAMGPSWSRTWQSRSRPSESGLTARRSSAWRLFHRSARCLGRRPRWRSC
jgi:class 3 adenylate cyclase